MPRYNSSNKFFASSKIYNSPDPKTIPMPNFDDEEEYVIDKTKTKTKINKVNSNLLKKFLKL